MRVSYSGNTTCAVSKHKYRQVYVSLWTVTVVRIEIDATPFSPYKSSESVHIHSTSAVESEVAA